MRKMNALISLFICSLSTACFAVPQRNSHVNKMPSPEEVTQKIDKIGARAFVLNLGDSSKKWRYIINKISTGQDEWLELVPRLSVPGLVGWHEDLESALAEAIPGNAQGVMNVIDKTDNLSIEQVCAMPIYNKSIAKQNEYVVNSMQSLYKVHTITAQKCLDHLIDVVKQAPPFSTESL